MFSILEIQEWYISDIPLYSTELESTRTDDINHSNRPANAWIMTTRVYH